MKKILIIIQTLFLLSLLPLHAALADDQLDPYNNEAPYSDEYFTIEELEDLVAPIALYPDPLIAQILPAATFIDQIDEAARFIKLFGKSARIDRQPWDVSVKAVAHYPDVLFMMDQKQDWTVSLGQAFVNQPEDVMYAIQRMRSHALAAGNLVSNRQQQVVLDGDYISIYPAEPQVIYVPVYDPQVVYFERPAPGYGLITFGVGFTIGAWLNRDFNWNAHRVYYHGWQGRGWIERARPHVQVRNTVYVNNRYSVVKTNRTVVRRDTARYREQIRRDVRVRPELPGRPLPPPRDRRIPVKAEPLKGRPVPPAAGQPRPAAPDRDHRPPATLENRNTKPGQPAAGQLRPGSPPRVQQPGIPAVLRDDKPKPATPGQSRPAAPTREQRQPARIDTREVKPAPAAAPVPSASIPAPKPAAQDLYRGRDTQKSQPASRPGYGGSGNGNDAGAYRERGAAGQEKMRNNNQPAPAPQAAPPQRPATVQQPAPGQRQAPAQRPAAVQRPDVPAEKSAPPKPVTPRERHKDTPDERVKDAPAERGTDVPAERGDKGQRQHR